VRFSSGKVKVLKFTSNVFSVAMIGVMGSTCACKPFLFDLVVTLNVLHHLDTSIRAIGKRVDIGFLIQSMHPQSLTSITQAHTLHSLNYFSLYCVIVSTILMIVQRIPVVVPANWMHLLFIFLIGIFGFLAQVGGHVFTALGRN
jgi:hypothetical protein